MVTAGRTSRWGIAARSVVFLLSLVVIAVPFLLGGGAGTADAESMARGLRQSIGWTIVAAAFLWCIHVSTVMFFLRRWGALRGSRSMLASAVSGVVVALAVAIVNLTVASRFTSSTPSWLVLGGLLLLVGGITVAVFDFVSKGDRSASS